MKKHENGPEGHEDEIGANIGDKNKKKEKKVDGFKTGDKKQKRYFDQPFDEQMQDPKSSNKEDDI